MATKARQQYHADEVTLSKERREFSISDDVQEKIDGIEEGAQVNTIETIRVNGNEISPDENKAIDLTIPGVIDSLSSTSITDALSARQGKILYDKIDNVSRIGHFLALWDASTGLPVTDPEVSPYEYHAGDFYTISVVASQGGTNYKPSGTEYISGQASTAVETDDVEVNDFYFYDGTYRRHMKNSGAGGMAVDGSLSTTSTNPVENRVITNALSGKQNTLTAGANIQINGNTISATDTKYTAGTGISIANGVISNTQTSAEWGNITGTLSDQTDLQTVLTSKATDADVVHKTGAETIAGTKTFSTSPVVPSKTTAATNTGTAIATEAQVYKKQDTLVSGTNIKTVNSNSLLGSGNLALNDVKVSATAPSNPIEGMVWYDTTNDSLKAYNGTSWETEGTKMVVLEYGVSTWQDFLDAYNKNAVVYCKVSSGSSGYRMAFMAYTAGRSTPTEVEFQYYRSRSSHSTAANQLDEVYVYKLTNAGVWTTTQRDTAAKAIAGTGIGLTYNSSGMTISADTSVLATQTDLNSKQDTLVSGTNIKTVNNNSLLGSGNITLNDVKSSTTAPSSPTEGQLWYDTTNDVLKVYDGTNWNAVDTNTTYNAGEGIEIGTYDDYSAMRGPCPKGFHIMTKAEGTNLINAFKGLGLNGTASFRQYFKVPTTGQMVGTTGQIGQSTNIAEFRLSEIFTTTGKPMIFEASKSYALACGGTTIDSCSIRPYKDVPVAPDNSWTTLYDGSSTSIGAGIFHNSTLGLISISSDGTNWITIADKNLGATVVYNEGDAVSEINAGKLYQWGNNYGFPLTGATTTSSTKVDTTGYGPGNYYTSNTFITVSNNNEFWTNPSNPNLRGGVTGVATLDNAISNTGVLSVNGQTGDVTIPTAEESNTKTFYLSSTSDLTNAQAAYDWYLAGKNPIIIYDNKSYIIYSKAGSYIYFANSSISSATYQNSVTQIRKNWVSFTLSGSTVTAINLNNDYSVTSFLNTATDYSTPYTPLYDGSPATKKYVDDSVVEYNAGEGIEIGTVQDYSAMRGPCPKGFHVPSKSEFQSVTDAGITISAWGSGTLGTNMLSYLKIPLSGYHSTNISLPGTAYKDIQTGLRCCTCTGTYYADSLNFGGATSTYNDTWRYPTSVGRGFGYFIRPFKDIPITPDSDWTVLYDGSSVSSGAGIFHNADLGLISISGDGINWTTIADKNLGATIVYNNGDTLNENNCGGWFQWGNNYMFPFNASFTYSTDKVDATGYGPGNYYNSSTYIGASQWDTSNNKNLRGGVTGVVTLDNAITNTGVLSVNGQTGNITIETFQLAPNSPLSPKYRWYGTQAQYDALTQYYTDEVGDTVYYTI